MASEKILVVLGSGILIKGMPKLMMERIYRAIRLFKTGEYKKIVLSGGIVNLPLPEAELMRVIVSEKIDIKKIIIEDKSQNTIQNAIFVWEKLQKEKIKSITIVSSKFHKRRLEHIFNQVFSHKKIEIKYSYVKHNLPPMLELKLKVNELLYYLALLVRGIK
ncbi:YdcF family protein [Candidatus Woesearchaeota archaeon]|mgnify:CR=1 FL=1|jgi:uncharacterized SAM-binding protein YcdF (DUF218 family)|nr:YdcF family protein [Candidatus Woesearchaeota archaeon]